MRIVLSVALGMLVAVPLFGRWRANVWLKKRMSAEQPIIHLSQPELRRPNNEKGRASEKIRVPF